MCSPSGGFSLKNCELRATQSKVQMGSGRRQRSSSTSKVVPVLLTMSIFRSGTGHDSSSNTWSVTLDST